MKTSDLEAAIWRSSPNRSREPNIRLAECLEVHDYDIDQLDSRIKRLERTGDSSTLCASYAIEDRRTAAASSAASFRAFLSRLSRAIPTTSP